MSDLGFFWSVTRLLFRIKQGNILSVVITVSSGRKRQLTLKGTDAITKVVTITTGVTPATDARRQRTHGGQGSIPGGASSSHWTAEQPSESRNGWGKPDHPQLHT